MPVIFPIRRSIDYPTVSLIHGDIARPILDFSRNRQTLTNTNNAMSSTVTPKFGPQSIYAPTTGKTTWPAKTVSADYTKPFTAEAWIYFNGTCNSGSGNLEIMGEITSTSAPANGDWTLFWYAPQAAFMLCRWTGSSTTIQQFYASGFGPSTISGGTPHHIFIQVNSNGNATVGVDGTCYNRTSPDWTGAQTPGGAYFGFGPALGNMWYTKGSNYFYIQELRITDGVARYPATGTYKAPTYQFG